MKKPVNRKLIEIHDEPDNHIYDGDFRVCDFEFDNDGVFLNLKIYSGKEHTKHRDVKICLSDFMFQIFGKLPEEQKEQLRVQINSAVYN